jgi:hypothetical protein
MCGEVSSIKLAAYATSAGCIGAAFARAFATQISLSRPLLSFYHSIYEHLGDTAGVHDESISSEIETMAL